MRDIEFRAWLKDEKKMYSVVELDVVYKYITCCKLGTKDRPYFYCDLEEIELMQYIGLKDKNGVKIFEGDIVKHVKGNTYKVEFYNGGFKLLRFNVYEGKPVAYHDFEVRRLTEMEVIGNICENPELLEVS